MTRGAGSPPRTARPWRCKWPAALAGAGLLLVLAGCALVRSPSIPPQGASQPPQENRWVLVENHRRLSGQDEPDHVWVREDAIPGTLNTLLFGKRSIIAPPEVAARHAPPPEGGRISALQGGPYARGGEGSAPPGRAGNAKPSAPGTLGAQPGAIGQLAPRGYVVYVDDKRVVIDLAAKEGLIPGMVMSIRREETPLVHPATGQSLGMLEEEIATARIVEVRENFSVGQIESAKAGVRIKIQDRAVPKP